METTEFFERVLKMTPLFQGMRDDHLATIAGCARNVRFHAGDLLFSEGEEAGDFYIVREGRVAVDMPTQTQRDLRIATLNQGEVVGWSWLFPPYRWKFNALAMEDSRAISLDGTCLRGKCENDSELGYELMKRFSSVVIARLQSTRLQILDVYGPPAGSGA